jgi:hypothetical protein
MALTRVIRIEFISGILAVSLLHSCRERSNFVVGAETPEGAMAT